MLHSRGSSHVVKKELETGHSLGIHPSRILFNVTLEQCQPHRNGALRAHSHTLPRFHDHTSQPAPVLPSTSRLILASATVEKLSNRRNQLRQSCFSRLQTDHHACLQRLCTDPLLPSGTRFHRLLASVPLSNRSAHHHLRQVMLPEDLASPERIAMLECREITLVPVIAHLLFSRCRFTTDHRVLGN